MRAGKRVLGAATAAVAGALGALPPSASAVPISCVFDGVVGNISPGVMLVGGSGRYEFRRGGPIGATRCGVSGAPIIPATITSTGSFTNVVCGTGEARSLHGATLPEFTTVRIAGVNHDMEYVIAFRGFAGDIDVRSVDWTPDPLPSNGRVVITPMTGSCTSATGVTAFEARGWFATV